MDVEIFETGKKKLRIQKYPNTCGQGLKVIETLRSNDADGNENVKKTIGFISKTTTLHVHHASLYISLPVFARLRRENAQFRVLWRT